MAYRRTQLHAPDTGGPRRNRRLRALMAVILAALALSACEADWIDIFGSGNNDNSSDDDTTAPIDETDIAGLNIAVSSRGFAATSNALSNAVTGQTRRILAVDFADRLNAPGADPNSNDTSASNDTSQNDTLRPTRLLFFNQPARVTPIIRADPRAALALPSRILVYQDRDREVGVAYNDTDYLRARYDVDAAADALAAIADTQQTLAQDAAGNDVSRRGDVDSIVTGQGIATTATDNDFDTTRARLVNAIDARPGLRRIEQIDNSAAAGSAGLALNPNLVVVFEDTDNDRALLRASQTTGIDLPQKILVARDNSGQVRLYYNDPEYIATRHQIAGRGAAIDAIADTLASLVATAAATDSMTNPDNVSVNNPAADSGSVSIQPGSLSGG